MTLYFDTSALVKLVVIEDGSVLAAELWNTGHPAASSVLCFPEGRAALAAAHRASRLANRAYAQSVADFDELQRELIVIDAHRSLASLAGDLAADFGLRGHDAVHLASAMAFDDVTVVTWDHELSHAALASGCAVAPSR